MYDEPRIDMEDNSSVDLSIAELLEEIRRKRSTIQLRKKEAGDLEKGSTGKAPPSTDETGGTVIVQDAARQASKSKPVGVDRVK